jgi:hypothetical protein
VECNWSSGMQLVYNNFFEDYKRIVANKSESKGIRWITFIDKDNIELVKIFLNAGIQIRHLKNLTFMNFAVDDRYFYATIDKMENGNVMNNLLTSNEPAYIRHQKRYYGLFPSINAYIRQERIGAIQLAKDAAKERNVKVRIMIPAN